MTRERIQRRAKTKTHSIACLLLHSLRSRLERVLEIFGQLHEAVFQRIDNSRCVFPLLRSTATHGRVQNLDIAVELCYAIFDFHSDLLDLRRVVVEDSSTYVMSLLKNGSNRIDSKSQGSSLRLD